ncbi:MAG: RNA polymerase sigma-70 factor [Bacteroidales bacterium]
MEKLIEKLKQGDKEAFEFIYHKYSLKLRYFANEYLLDMNDSMDIVQNVYIQLIENIKDIDEGTNLEAYLITSTRNASISYLRKLKIRQNYFELKQKKDEREINLQALESFEFTELTFSEMRERVNESIAQLPSKCREVFLLSRKDQLKYSEIADKLDISKRTVERRMTEALSILRVKLKDYYPLLIFMI